MNCKNCELPLEESSNYCLICGAKVIRNRLTLRNLFSSFSHEFFNYDNKFLQTFLHLIKDPRNVIGGYIKGTRKKFVNPISFLMIAITITGIEYFLLSNYFPNYYEMISFGSQDLPGFNEKVEQFIKEYQSFIIISMIPFYALMSKIVFLKRKDFNLTEHLVIFMYVVAQLSIMGMFFTLGGALLGYNVGSISIVLLPLQIVYSAYCLKMLFNLSLKGIILRTLLFLMVFIIFYLVATVLAVVGIFIFYGEEFFIQIQEAQKASQGG
jgi:hypothetical protein